MIHPVIIKLNEAVKIADSYYLTLSSHPHRHKEEIEEIKNNLPSPGIEFSSKWLEPGEDWKTAKFDKGDTLGPGYLTPLPDKQTIRKWDRQASNLNMKFCKVYNAYKLELKLPYSAKDFSWWLIMTDENGLLSRARQVLDGLVEIRDRRELELETEKATKTPPQPGQGGVEAKEAPQKKVSPYLDSLVAKLVGLLAAVVTLIMFVYWLRT